MAADRRALARGCLLAATLFAACVDGPTSPGSFGELRIRPSYPAADAPSTLGLAVDSARVRVVRPGDASVPLVDAMVTYTSDTASLGWLLELIADEESMQVDLEVWDDGARVYEGNDVTLVRDGSVATALVAPVMMTYVGPAIADTVIVSPDAVEFDALNDTVELAGEVRDRHGVPVETAIAWTSDDESVATVDAVTGTVTAVGNGATTVHGTVGTVRSSVGIAVQQRVHAVAITPGGAALSALGATQQFSAVAEDRLGSSVADAPMAWTSSDPTVASVDANAGLVTAVGGGSASITATSGEVEATVTVTVNPVADVASITVSPTSGTLTAIGATQPFTAVARDAGGNVLAGIQFTWESTAPGVASVDVGTGLATAVAHGTAIITATAGAVTGSATLSVDLAPTVASITVAPGSVSLSEIGATQQFTATASDASGAVVPGIVFVWTSNAPSVAAVDATGLVTAVAHGNATISASVGGITGTATLTVDLAQTVASISVDPDGATLTALGATQQFTATAFDASGAVVPGIPFAWASSVPGVATVDAGTGLATATGHGEATISATAGGLTSTATLAVNLTESVSTVTIEPDDATLTAIGATQQFTATAFDASGAVVPGIVFVWTSDAPNVASVESGTGLATAVAHGSATISVTGGGTTGTATLTVDLAQTVASISVSPDAASVSSLGATEQFTAVALDASGVAVPGIPFTWTSSATTIATIDIATGLATTTGHGETTIAAAANGITGTATLTVELTSQVASVSVDPDGATLATLGATQQFTATAFDASGAVVPGIPFAWASSVPGVATVDAGTGLATATGHGEATISATAGGLTSTATLAVNLAPAVASIAVEPDGATLSALGTTQQFTATARDLSGAVVPGITFDWTSSAPSVASVDPGTGLAAATGHGETTIAASASGITGTATLAVELTQTVASIAVAPDGVTLSEVGATQQFTATALDADGAVVPGIVFTWMSSSPEVASVDAGSGLATATGHGASTIAASANGMAGTATLTVDLTTQVASVSVDPDGATLTALGATQQFVATARDASGAVVPGIAFIWTSSVPGVATVEAGTGLATATGNGASTISASASGITGDATLTVDLTETIASISIEPDGATLTAIGATQQFTATARDASGTVVPGITFAWSSSVPSVASVDPSTGLASATGHGESTISATANGMTGTATLAVDLTSQIESVIVEPVKATLTAFDQTQQFTAEVRDADGAVLPGVPVTWSSSDAGVATVDAGSGLATAVANGVATITAATSGVSGTATLTVAQQASRVEVTPQEATIDGAGASQQFTARAYDANDHLITGASFTWASLDEGIATVSDTGLATAVASGTVSIKAYLDGLYGQAVLTVR